MNAIIKIEGMSCHHCEMRVEKSLSGLKGVKKIKANHLTKQAEIYAKEVLPVETVKQAVEDAGYEFVSMEVSS